MMLLRGHSTGCAAFVDTLAFKVSKLRQDSHDDFAYAGSNQTDAANIDVHALLQQKAHCLLNVQRIAT
ncbi:hypothetical protein SAMN04488241_10512 [Sphingomonas rubra]|uniref:Uncharacterized protein n=1 Tax=Sphingomonas rubra TaxID=634430 RepID=A0A1I5S6Y8_9SPHN|nr:hypothetical protein SAMN04488241_10512 [Sphingomonas rubra]